MWTKIVCSIRNSFKSLKKFWNSHEAELKDLLSKDDNTDFNHVDQAGWYPIHRGIMLANIEILRKLLQKGTNPNLNVKGYSSPLCKALNHSVLYRTMKQNHLLISIDSNM